MEIDAHHHFWRYDPVEYGWIGEEMAGIRRDFLPPDLEAEIRAVGIDAVVSVQARQTVEETVWLLGFARAHTFIRGVVGWVPLTSPYAAAHLERFADEPKLRGVRHVLQGEPDDRYMLRADFNAGMGAVTATGLAYDLLIFERHLPAAVALVDRHPGQTFVLDHLAKPRVREGVVEPWASGVRELARRPNVYCKVSGLVTEADLAGWTEDQMRPYLDMVLAAFTPARLIFGSDWPVCLAAGGYGRWVGTVRRWAAALSPGEQRLLFGGSAKAAYRLS